MGAHISIHSMPFCPFNSHDIATFSHILASVRLLLIFSSLLSVTSLFSLFQLWIAMVVMVMVMMPNSQCTLNIYWNAKQIQLIKHTIDMPITLILNFFFTFSVSIAKGEREKLYMKLLCVVAICNLWVWVENVWCAVHICAVINTDYWYRYFTLIIL